jgi:acyl-CoA reductase-like NAD-dependent aldehyde dehydrogenase
MFDVEMFIDGAWRTTDMTTELIDPYSGEVLGQVAQADVESVEQALTVAAATAESGPLHPVERGQILLQASALVRDRSDQLISTIVAESGFTVSDARGEVTRAEQTFRLAGEEATRITGEMVPLDSAPGVSRRIGFTLRMPVGAVCVITPFNSPLNTVAHKVAPAIAAGNSVVLKPASKTPMTANLLVRVLLDAGLPPPWIQVLHGPGSALGVALLTDPRIDFYSFTGSTATGEHIARTVGLRRTQLELGAVSPTLVMQSADLEQAALKIPRSSFRKAGQVCTSIQRLLIEEPVVDELVERLVAGTESLVVGDPRQPETSVGPLVTREDAERIGEWVDEAADQGAEILTGGRGEGSVYQPTLVSRPPPHSRLVKDEIFGPVLTIEPVESRDEAVAVVNSSPFGLATGVFTNDLREALEIAHSMRMGSIHVNETSSSRVDLMPYGGVKSSGHGKEGPRYAIRELTEERLITIDYGAT